MVGYILTTTYPFFPCPKPFHNFIRKTLILGLHGAKWVIHKRLIDPGLCITNCSAVSFPGGFMLALIPQLTIKMKWKRTFASIRIFLQFSLQCFYFKIKNLQGIEHGAHFGCIALQCKCVEILISFVGVECLLEEWLLSANRWGR